VERVWLWALVSPSPTHTQHTQVKKIALKAAIMALLGGEAMPRILMQVIRFCINSDDKQLKKLCMLYWEVVPKYQPLTSEELLMVPPPPRKMLPEMLLVCNALMLDLQHPNEYVRGSMLRFLCKVKDAEILTSLIPNITSCLEHRHPYVRKNAALTVLAVYKLHGDALLPDAPNLVAQFLQNETDTAARRNAFLMMIHENEDLAIQFLASHINQVASEFGDGFSLLVLELCRVVCRKDPTQKSRFVQVLFQMLQSPSAAVSYEAAWTLCSLSKAPSALRAAAVTYTNLLNGQNDHNVQLIVLERLENLGNAKILQELLMDILRGVTSPNPDICQKVLDICLQNVHTRSVQNVVSVLKREVAKTLQDTTTPNERIRNLLVDAIHACAVRFSSVAESVVHTLLDFLGTDSSALQVAIFCRAIVEQYPDLRSSIVQKLGWQLGELNQNQVVCVALWILGEYSNDITAIASAYDQMTQQCGKAPFIETETEIAANANANAATPKVITKNVVLSDGTYATQTSYSEPTPVAQSNQPSLRRMLIQGDVFLGEILAVALTKLCLKAQQLNMPNAKRYTAETVLLLCGLIKMASTTVLAQRSSVLDCTERLTLCVRALLDPKAQGLVQDVFLKQGQVHFAEYLALIKDKQQQQQAAAASTNETSTTQADDGIHFRQLHNTTTAVDLEETDGLDRAIGRADWATELNHVYPLTGFADDVYAEALVTVHDYDIVLEILVLNRTPQTLQNVSVELSTMGDMKIVERPVTQTIGPLDQVTVRASIKVSSTETGHIFGTIVYDVDNVRQYIHLNDIHMDIMDYIRPATCTDEVFRSMWAEFEWENKVAIATNRTELLEFLEHIVSSTNMTCLTPPEETQDSSFLAANLYARRYVMSVSCCVLRCPGYRVGCLCIDRSCPLQPGYSKKIAVKAVFAKRWFIASNLYAFFTCRWHHLVEQLYSLLYACSVFGEDALVNVSVEKKDDDGKLAGYIRIRSKTQGIALSLGDRITSVQRAPIEAAKN